MKKTVKLVQLAVLTGLIVLMAFTPIGFLKVGVLEFTLIMIPVAIGAIVLGPASGAFLGGVFGIVSFLQCVFGLSSFGVMLLGINVFYTAVVCIIPRVLMGWLCGLIFKGLAKIDKTKFISYGAASLSGAVLNTLFFMSALMLLFGRTEYIQGMMQDMGKLNPLTFVVALVGVNGLVEAIVCFVVATAVSKALMAYLQKSKIKIQ